ncbi:hypothetical protein, partial [Streptomyces sp. NPDC058304]|uniref:hypothetical protein n=1 Tax=Streptomyces sp. NPDC058304 TaxID=3346437 RepID=UPI0036EDE30D
MSESPFTGVYGNEAAPDPEPAVVPAPRTGDRRAARRRRSAEAGPVPAAAPDPTGRRPDGVSYTHLRAHEKVRNRVWGIVGDIR